MNSTKDIQPKDLLPSKWFLLVPFLFYVFQIFNFSEMEGPELLRVHVLLLLLGILFIVSALFTSRLRHKKWRRLIFGILTFLFAFTFFSHTI